MSFDRLSEPASLPSSVVIFISISHALLLGRSLFLRLGLCIGLGARLAELARLRGILRQRLLHRVAHGDPAALGARHRTLNEDQAALDVELDDLEIERGDAVHAHVAGHLLVLEGLARVLTATGRTDRT